MNTSESEGQEGGNALSPMRQASDADLPVLPTLLEEPTPSQEGGTVSETYPTLWIESFRLKDDTVHIERRWSADERGTDRTTVPASVWDPYVALQAEVTALKQTHLVDEVVIELVKEERDALRNHVAFTPRCKCTNDYDPDPLTGDRHYKRCPASRESLMQALVESRTEVTALREKAVGIEKYLANGHCLSIDGFREAHLVDVETRTCICGYVQSLTFHPESKVE